MLSERAEFSLLAQTGPYATCAFFCVMDDEHGEAMASLQFAQVREQGRYLTAGVFVDAMQAHERIQHQQPRFELFDSLLEPGAIRRHIQPHGRGGDHVNIQFLQAHVCGGTDAFEPPAHDVECVLGGIEQHAPRA
jgi:hypothetical protein